MVDGDKCHGGQMGIAEAMISRINRESSTDKGTLE